MSTSPQRRNWEFQRTIQWWPTPVHPCRDNSGRMAWGYQGCTKSSMPIPQPPWCHDCRRWTNPKRRKALIIPPLEREKILQAIHKGHMGITKCQYHARQCVYWPRINEDIRKMVEACPTCQHHQPQEPRQPLQPTPAPECPWQHLGADYFSFNGFE